MGRTFAEKFEDAIRRKHEEDGVYGLRTLARDLSGGDRTKIDSIRRRLHKYRPPKGGGAAEVTPTAPTRWEIEKAMGLERDSLAPDVDTVAASHDLNRFLADIAPLRRLWEIGDRLDRGELVLVSRADGRS